MEAESYLCSTLLYRINLREKVDNKKRKAYCTLNYDSNCRRWVVGCGRKSMYRITI